MSLNIKHHEPLDKHLNFRLGGEAKFFVEVKTLDDVREACAFAQQEHVPYVVLGGGSNMLVADEGYNGLVIKMVNRDIVIDGATVTVAAGAISSMVARQTAEAGLTGFEWAISLPGTIGGAVRGNAGCFGGEMRDNLLSVDVLHDSNIETLTASDCYFAYRSSVFKTPHRAADIILSATLRLQPGSVEMAKEKLQRTLAARKSTQPLGASSAGCMFKNFEYQDPSVLKKLAARVSIPADMLERKRIGAGFIIDTLGLKGVCVGEACVSREHGNFLANIGHATASDVKKLIDKIREQVYAETGILLEEEVQLIGFDS
jgi:UDP-N-acetylmuramate dehydrogenase